MKIYGLLYTPDAGAAVTNAKIGNIDILDLYLLNAELLSYSLQARGTELNLLTNNRNRLKERLATLNPKSRTSIVEIAFPRQVPANIRFREAHHKLDAFNYFAKQDQRSCLLDLDVIANPSVTTQVSDLAKHSKACFYNIADQVIPAYGERRISRDLKLISLQDNPLIWAGGEFLCGDMGFFESLSHTIDEVWPSYVETASGLHHQGDEIITTAALQKMIRKGYKPSDISRMGIIARQWSGRIRHVQPDAKHTFASNLLIHLPQEKVRLANLARLLISDVISFDSAYRSIMRTVIMKQHFHKIPNRIIFYMNTILSRRNSDIVPPN